MPHVLVQSHLWAGKGTARKCEREQRRRWVYSEKRVVVLCTPDTVCLRPKEKMPSKAKYKVDF